MLGSVKRPALLAICAIAVIHAAVYIAYQRPDWDVSWTDQAGYRRLGAVLATTGMFTRYPDSAVFVPEVLRTPGYPAFVAAVYRVAGVGNDLAVTSAQALVFAGICVLAFHLARRARDERTGLKAAFLVALFSPLPYFGGLVLTELWTAFVATAAMLQCLRAVQRQRVADFALAGVLLSATTLVRPAFVLLPFFLAVAMPVLVKSERQPPALRRWAVLAVTAALTLAPWFTYNYVYLGQFTLSPAGGVGRGLWEGAWQGHWPGKTQARLTALAAEQTPRAQLDAQVRAVAAETGLAADLMLDYVHEWRDIRAIWEAPVDPVERAKARVVADGEYRRAALLRINQDPLGHVLRRLTTGTFVLWAAEVPIRHSDINATPTAVIRSLWFVQVVLALLAAFGCVQLARGGRRTEAMLLGLPLVYVTGVHLPLLCEARQSLPVKPVMLVLAVIGVTEITRRTR